MREFGLGGPAFELGDGRADRCPPWLVLYLLGYGADTLEDLWIIGSLHYADDDDEDYCRHFVLSKLEKLFIEYEDPDEVANFIPFIRTPALQQLELSDTLTSLLPEDEQPTSDDMLTAMMHHLPLDQLQRLVLRGVIFQDEIALPEPDDFLFKGRVSPEDVPVTMRFLASLTSLKLLSLCVLEDERVLPLLNYPRAPIFDKHGQALPDIILESRHLPLLPALACLHLTAVNSEKAAHVHQFMDDRAEFTICERMLDIIVEGNGKVDASL